MRRNLLQDHGWGRKTLNAKVLGWYGQGKGSGMGNEVEKKLFWSFLNFFHNLGFDTTFADLFVFLEIFTPQNESFVNVHPNFFCANNPTSRKIFKTFF